MTAVAAGASTLDTPTRRSTRALDQLRRYAPAVAVFVVLAAILLDAGTPAVDIARYTGYALLGVVLPGTLVYRALRARPHTLVEDLAVGAAVGLILELAAWAVLTGLGLEHWLRYWPVAVLLPFLAVPRLRRCWRVRGYTPVPTGWAWSVAAVVVGFTAYLAESFLYRNPILPVGEGQAQYIDLPFQLSIAGAATHQMPPDVPQVAGEPLHYHWFGFAHMAAASLVSGVDLPTVFFRLAVPALCLLAVVLVAVVGWRITGRPYAGAVAAALMFTIGEFGYENGIRQLFGTQATFIVWGSPSMTYSWVLLLPLIAVLADRIGPARGVAVPPLGRGAWVLAALLLVASTGAKASSVPVVVAALALTALVTLVVRRRLAWPVLVAGALALAAQGFATAILFAFESHGVTVDPFSGLRPFVGTVDRPAGTTALLWVAVLLAFLVNLQLRLAGIVALIRYRRFRLEPVQVFLLGGALAGPAIYLLVGHPGSSNQYFIRAGFAFGVIASAWGYAELLERARLSTRSRILLGVGAAGFALVLTLIQLDHPAEVYAAPTWDVLRPLFWWAAALGGLAVLGALLWPVLAGQWPRLRGRGAAILLTGVLVAGAPGLVLDAAAGRQYPNGGAYAVVPMPQSRVDAARWVYEHSDPDDIVATNVHCRAMVNGYCDARSFWLSAYTERAVLVEGWSFAPRMVGLPGGPYAPFWDQERLQANDEAFTAPTPEGLATLRDRYGVRWLVADRSVEQESPDLSTLATIRFDNGNLAVYELR
ncbi:hypothetical protein [Micromonospora sp. NBC_01796]|uniref:hypothetical protein n=1 Tax=Micromonospora sp. NBC_01796 TaxID=2975987 RepID=UPI002DDA4E99|nr:hypothetical protein [Micromonospora sp. NBC_01796]WSA83162.1 hypothetical protein OIE47_22405 [Micromonospora sp. NBC_01796]